MRVPNFVFWGPFFPELPELPETPARTQTRAGVTRIAVACAVGWHGDTLCMKSRDASGMGAVPAPPAADDAESGAGTHHPWGGVHCLTAFALS